jgi:hypothetical protein
MLILFLFLAQICTEVNDDDDGEMTSSFLDCDEIIKLKV